MIDRDGSSPPLEWSVWRVGTDLGASPAEAMRMLVGCRRLPAPFLGRLAEYRLLAAFRDDFDRRGKLTGPARAKAAAELDRRPGVELYLETLRRVRDGQHG